MSRDIQEGDTVIIYANYKQTYAVKVKKGETFQSRFGALRHEQLIGQPFGRKIDCTKGYVYVLKTSPELHTLTLHHRTQILYTHDVSLILCALELKPGSILIEAGTGSGSFTRAAARTLAPNGHLYTFEANEERSRLAVDDFKTFSHVTVQHRDVCKDGFGLVDKADAVFLDLPAPWQVVDFALEALKRNSVCRFCSFSPCIEQVQKTCQKLQGAGFTELETVECVPRQLKVVELQQGAPNKGMPVKRRKPNQGADMEEPKKEMEEDEEDTKPPMLSFITDPPEQPTHTGYLTFATLLLRR